MERSGAGGDGLVLDMVDDGLRECVVFSRPGAGIRDG